MAIVVVELVAIVVLLGVLVWAMLGLEASLREGPSYGHGRTDD